MKKVIIIGAGPAGITAGYELLKNAGKDEYDVTILEETQAIGGISRTVLYHGNRMDIGGHRFFSKNDDVMKWWTDMMPLQGAASYDDRVLGREMPLCEGGPDPEVSDRVMLTRNRVSRIYYKHKFFDYPVSLSWNTIHNMGFVTTMQAGFSYLGSTVRKLPETSLENFYINRFGKKLYSMFFEGYTEKLWGRHPSEISADWGSQRVKGLSITAVLKNAVSKIVPGKNKGEVETSLIESFYYPKFGPGQLWETAADEFVRLGGALIKGCKVTKVTTADGAVKSVIVETQDGTKEMEADIVISSMPVKDLVGGMDNVPQEAADAAAGLPYRDFVTCGLLVNHLTLKNKTKLKTLSDIVPDCWIYVQDTGVKLGRIQIFNNWSPYLVRKPEKTVWIGLEYFCAEGDEYWNMSDEEWKNMGISELVKMGVLRSERNVGDAHVERVRKAYPAYFDTYKDMDKIIDYLNSIDGLYCVGRNGQHRYNNMDHSMMTSFETVKHILGEDVSKEEIWKVNTEKEYHEKKEEK